VIETTPPADAIDVEPDTVVQVICSRPLLVGGEGASLTLEGPAGTVGGTLRWVPADERTDPLAEGRGMNTAGRSQAFVGLEGLPLHMNFEGWQPIPRILGRFERLYNLHIYLTDP
jgi:hypothetical protein